MSAVSSNSSGRDLDAIESAQRAHEPSMEEILASIRNIIAEDPARAPPLWPPQPAPAPLAEMADPTEPAARRDEPAGAAERPDVVAPTVVWRRPRAVEAEPARTDEAPLLSAEANEAAALSFGALSAGLDARSAELADSMVREMLRPMLKQWLDENLPAVVERLVRAEIERVARGRK